MMHAPLPTYDWAKREPNVFAWLIDNAQRVRAQRTQVQLLDHAVRAAERRLDYRLLGPYEAQGDR